MSRPCRYCLAAYPSIADEVCELTHRDEQRVYDLATAMASVFQHQLPTDEQVGWFVDDADAVVDDFGAAPEKWHIHRLPPTRNDEFVLRFRINNVTYVVQDGEGKVLPVRLSTLREWQREADVGAAAARAS